MLITNATFGESSGSVTIKGANNAMLNGIRRTMIRDVPALAVSRVEITKNNTPMPDDMLSHRIGLIPMYAKHGEEDVTRIELKVDKSGPCELYSEDIICDAVTVVRGVYICPLYEGQQIALTGSFEVGVGKDHARFQRCVAPAYSIRHDGLESSECFCVDIPASTDCERCGKFKPCLETQKRDKVHIMTYESIGGMAPQELLTSTLQVMIAKLDNVLAKLTTLQNID
tara:strand:+ start:5058 stop:5738 length:681 start_codon:yes stop_codon:yes gene_type:complete